MIFEEITFYDCVAFIKRLCFAFFCLFDFFLVYKITVRSHRKIIGCF